MSRRYLDPDGYAKWKQTPGGRWVLWGDHAMLADAFEGYRMVDARLQDGSVVEVEIEYVTMAFADGTAYAWPTGTKATVIKLSQLPKVEAPARKMRGARRHTGARRACRSK